MQLREKVAVVTGGAVRLGKSIVLALADEGVRIGLHYNQSADAADKTLTEIRERGGVAVSVQADFCEPVTAARTVMQRVSNDLGPVEILINSAALFEAGTLSDTTEQQWDRHFNINPKTPYFLCQAFAGQLPSGRRGHIINMADWRATRPGIDHPAYTLTKSGLITMTHSLAQELAPNIQVNAIAPGAILPPAGGEQDHLDRLANRIPLGRTGSPREVTEALLYLLRSDFVTGEIIHVTGGEQL